MIEDNDEINIISEGKLLKFENPNTKCKVVYNTSDKMAYNLADFSCGNRGKGDGLKLLYYSLQYIQTKIPIRERPFRIELAVIPQASNPSENDFLSLLNYYKKLGFNIDEHAKQYGNDDEMYAQLDSLTNNIGKLIKVGGGKSRKSRKYKKKSRKLGKSRKSRKFK